MRILIVEDEIKLATILKRGLEEKGFSVDHAADGEEGLFMAVTYPYDVILLDILLPKMDGFTVLQKVREKDIQTPVIMLTAKGEVEDRIRGLNIGADDYIPKPFDFKELVARMQSVIRRSKGRPSPVITIGDLEVDVNAKTVRREGRDIRLSAKEFSILEYLALNANRVVSKSELMEHVYDGMAEHESNVIDVYITYLRRKIDKEFAKQIIHTVRGMGYMLKGEE
ncbi:MAG: response regulator transcription factor [Thermodesulfovibrionales bacterium]|jgi:DNA-binding response OmpR family regulator